MDSIDIPADRVPDGLKPCEQILKRAKEVKKVEPVVAYWCCFYAAQKALKVPERTKNDTLFLMSLLDALEQMKATMADNDAIHNEAAGAAYIQNFALKVFMSADNDDRNGVTGKATIRKFVVSGQFIEVLSCFENGMTEEMSQKLQYARWKAADGAKALREGRTPSSGPQPELALPSLPTSPPSGASQLPTTASSHSSPAFDPTSRPSPRPSPSPLGGNNKASLPNIDTSLSLPSSVIAHTALTQADLASANLSEGFTEGRTPQRSASTASGAWSTVATPGLPDDEAEERRFPGVPTGSGGGKEEGSGICAQAPGTPTAKADTALPPPTSTPRSPGDSKKNVRFMGPDGAPLSPAHTHFTVDSYDSPAAPPPTEYSYAQDQVDGTGRTQGQGQGGDVPGSAVLGSKGLASQPTSAATAKHGQGQGSVPMQSGGSGSGSGSGGNGSGSGSSRNARPRGDSDATRTSDNSTSLRNTGVLGVNGTSRPAPPYTPSPSAPSAPPSANIARNGTTPSAPPLHTVSFSQASTSTPHAPAPSTPAPAPAAAATPKPTRKTVEQCQKHARWAVSALEFDDPETARSELRKALALLEG